VMQFKGGGLKGWLPGRGSRATPFNGGNWKRRSSGDT
jgi:hypothetical protein